MHVHLAHVPNLLQPLLLPQGQGLRHLPLLLQRHLVCYQVPMLALLLPNRRQQAQALGTHGKPDQLMTVHLQADLEDSEVILHSGGG